MFVEVNNLSLLFKVKDIDSTFLRKNLLKKILNKNSKANNLWALKNINFNLNKGDRMGIIGTNGSGKSTLIKTLSGILSPVEGSKINIQGKFVPIIEPWGLAEITDSLENNIFLIGLILGFEKNDIKRNFAKILKFSDLEDKKVHQFSSLSTGMKLRLVFAIVFIMGSQIFFMDEFLTTGDEKFRNKVIKHLNDISQDIITVICSHERKLIQDFCNKILVLDKGEQIYFGDIDKGFEIYNNLTINNI